jgi:hypothetical protein
LSLQARTGAEQDRSDGCSRKNNTSGDSCNRQRLLPLMLCLWFTTRSA